MIKPHVKLINTNGNIFAILGKASNALKQSGRKNDAIKMQNEVMASSSYEKALAIITNYVEPY